MNPRKAFEQILENKLAAAVSYEEQLRLLDQNEPRVKSSGDLYTVEIYSPFVKKYIAQGEWGDPKQANQDLKGWQKAHKETVQRLRDVIKSESKEASTNPRKALEEALKSGAREEDYERIVQDLGNALRSASGKAELVESLAQRMRHERGDRPYDARIAAGIASQMKNALSYINKAQRSFDEMLNK